MKNRARWYLLALVLVVLATVTHQMSAGWLREPIAHAQFGDGSVVFISDSLNGLIPGQAARISVANLAHPRLGGSLFFQCKVFDSNAVLLFESPRTEVAPGTFRFQDISRRDLNVDGEPGTGRVQTFMRIRVFLPRNIDISEVVLGGEILDELTGQTKGDFNPPPPAMQRFVDVPPTNPFF